MQESSELTSPVSIQIQRTLKRIPFNWFLILILLMVGTAMVAPFYFSRKATVLNPTAMPVPNTHDMAQHLAIMMQFDKVLRSGTLYPRWLPDVNNGYGLAWTNFYSPAFYYSTSLVNAGLNDWINSLFVISVLSFFASGFAFYLLARQFYGRLASTTAALFYLVLPYHTIDLYWRGALPELQGFILVPLITYFAYKTGSRGKLRDYAGLGLCQGIYYMTHFPVAYLMTYTIALYGLIWALSKRDWRIALRIATGMALALVLSAIYWLPAVVESKYVQEHFTTLFPYHNSYITLLPAGDRFGELINQSFAVQALALLVAIAILRLMTSHNKQSQGREIPENEGASHSQTGLWITLGVTTTFMVTSLSIYISKLIPKIEAVSFAMRWMVITSFFTALVVSAAIDRLGKTEGIATKALWAGRLTVAVVVALNLWITTRHIIREGLSHQALQSPTVHYEPAFIPKGATSPRELPDTPNVIIEPEGAKYEVIQWKPNHRELIVTTQAPSSVRLKTYNYYGWSARLDGQSVSLSSDPDGIQIIDVPPGLHEIEVSFTNTPPRTFGAILFGLGFLTIVGLIAIPQLRRFQDRIKTKSETGQHRNDYSGAIKDVSAEKSFAHQESGKPGWAIKPKSLAIISLVILATVVLLFLTTRLFRTADQAKTNSATSAGALPPGSEARLQIPRQDWVMVARNEEALNELMTALPAKDAGRIEALVQSGQVLRVANGTKIRILGFGIGKLRIRILSGDHDTAEGWVPESWVGR